MNTTVHMMSVTNWQGKLGLHEKRYVCNFDTELDEENPDSGYHVYALSAMEQRNQAHSWGGGGVQGVRRTTPNKSAKRSTFCYKTG